MSFRESDDKSDILSSCSAMTTKDLKQGQWCFHALGASNGSWYILQLSCFGPLIMHVSVRHEGPQEKDSVITLKLSRKTIHSHLLHSSSHFHRLGRSAFIPHLPREEAAVFTENNHLLCKYCHGHESKAKQREETFELLFLSLPRISSGFLRCTKFQQGFPAKKKVHR